MIVCFPRGSPDLVPTLLSLLLATPIGLYLGKNAEISLDPSLLSHNLPHMSVNPAAFPLRAFAALSSICSTTHDPIHLCFSSLLDFANSLCDNP